MTDKGERGEKLERLAVVLFNLGGPDSPEAVQPFLFNLFNDRAIIGLPQPLRWLIAKLISSRRAPLAREIYAHIGGRSPLVPETEAQAEALKVALSKALPDSAVEIFIAMRYWHPFAAEAARRTKAFAPDHIALLPLYPQYSTTTTDSSLKDWEQVARAAGLDAKTTTTCCYAAEEHFVAAHAALIAPRLREMAAKGPVRLLLSAHGLPQKVVDAGDPYAAQVEEGARRIVAALGADLGRDDIDARVCYQSRVGPLKWLEPSTEAEIRRAGEEGTSLLVAPVAFVSEHSETLVELDIEYAKLAHECGVPDYRRVPALGTEPHFIDGLADLVVGQLAGRCGSWRGERQCDPSFGKCYMAA